MGKTISPADVRELRRELDETRMLVRGVLQSIIGKERTDAFEAQVESAAWWREVRRADATTPLYPAVPIQERRHLDAAGFESLEQVAAKKREEIAAFKGVGPATMRKLDDALIEHGLSWMEED